IVPDAELLAGVKTQLDKIEAMPDKEAPAYHDALVNLQLRSAGIDLGPELKKKVDSLLGDVGKEVAAAQDKVRKAFALDNPNEFGKVLTAESKPYKNTELAAWFRDAGQVYLVRAHLKRYEEAKGKLPAQARAQAEAQIYAGLVALRPKMRTPDFIREIEEYMTQFQRR
ncbi:MAG: hypothetical protein AB7K24_15400, partial [Gemmataceae bacterium]